MYRMSSVFAVMSGALLMKDQSLLGVQLRNNKITYTGNSKTQLLSLW